MGVAQDEWESKMVVVFCSGVALGLVFSFGRWIWTELGKTGHDLVVQSSDMGTDDPRVQRLVDNAAPGPSLPAAPVPPPDRELGTLRALSGQADEGESPVSTERTPLVGTLPV